MNKNKMDLNSNKLEFNTYCIFTKEKQDVCETIGWIFKDYIENLKTKKL